MWNPPDPEIYNLTVWKIASQIPPGRVMSYGQIAAMIPAPEGILPPDYERMAPRWVGKAMNATPADHGIPWQRVINSKGGISLPAGSQAAEQQKQLLLAEGVAFNAKGLVDFDEYGWDGPDAGWLQENGLYPPPSLKRRPGPGTQPSLF